MPIVTDAKTTPTTPPQTASSALSVSSCRTSRPRPAPSAARIASSRSRPSIRASVRLATFAHAISRTMPVMPSRISSISRAPLVSASRTSTAVPWKPDVLRPIDLGECLVVGEVVADRADRARRLLRRHARLETAEHVQRGKRTAVAGRCCLRQPPGTGRQAPACRRRSPADSAGRWAARRSRDAADRSSRRPGRRCSDRRRTWFASRCG